MVANQSVVKTTNLVLAVIYFCRRDLFSSLTRLTQTIVVIRREHAELHAKDSQVTVRHGSCDRN